MNDLWSRQDLRLLNGVHLDLAHAHFGHAGAEFLVFDFGFEIFEKAGLFNFCCWGHRLDSLQRVLDVNVLARSDPSR